MAARNGREQKASGKIGKSLEEKDGIKPGVGPETREKEFKCGEKDGVSGQTIHGGGEIGARAHAVDAVMQEVVTQLEIVECVVVAGAREPDECETKNQACSDPQISAARPARRVDGGGHIEEDKRGGAGNWN